jgi:uncharacterized membrane protein
MSTAGDSQHKIESYLGRLRKGLRGVREADASDIVEELRSHIVEKAAEAGEVSTASVNSVLVELGSPDELASQYVTDDLLARAESSRAPWTILGGIFHWATLSVSGFLVFIVCTVGYVFGGAFLLAALVKPFNPRVGLWKIGADTYSLALGMTGLSPQGHELLGWSLIPIGLCLGGGTIMLTTHFALWSIRNFHQARRLRLKHRS